MIEEPPGRRAGCRGTIAARVTLGGVVRVIARSFSLMSACR